MAITLHRCRTLWFKGPHPCWQVQKALGEAGVEYEVVKHPVRRSKRTEYIQLTGQKLFPAIQLEDGTMIRRESKELVQMVKSGTLPGSAPAAPDASPPATPPASDEAPPASDEGPPAAE